MVRTVVALGASAVLGALGAFLVLANAYPNEGPWLPVTPGHGIHVGDVVILALWAAATWGLVRWARSAGSHQH